MYDRENEDQYAIYQEKNKEFLGNSITAMDVHPERNDYVVVGFDKG